MIRELTREFAKGVATEIEVVSPYKCKILSTHAYSAVCITTNGEVTVNTPMYSLIFHEDSFYILSMERIFETSELASPKFTPKRIAEIILENFKCRYSKEVERGYV